MVTNWLFSYAHDGDLYTIDFSETFINDYLRDNEVEQLYCCLSYRETEEAIYVYGHVNTLIIECRLIINGKTKDYVMRRKGMDSSERITLKNVFEIGDTMAFPAGEIFSSQEAVGSFISFYREKKISSTVDLVEKTYLHAKG